MNIFKSRDGSALFTAMVVLIILSMVVATMGSIAGQRAYTARKMADRVRAIAIAEAGVNEAYSRLSTNFALKDNASNFPLTVYGGGNFDVSLRPLDIRTLVITVTSHCNSASAVVVVNVRDYGTTTNNPPFNWPEEIVRFSVVAGGSFDFGGCGDIVGQTTNMIMHSNDKLTLSGGADANVSLTSSQEIKINNNASVTGDLTAPIVEYQDEDVGGTVTTAIVPVVNIPQPDMTRFYNWARDNGQVYTNGFTPPTDPWEAPGGVIWVVGDLTLNGATLTNTTVIATGDIHLMSQETDVYASEYGFALVSLNGDIQVQVGGTIRGISYAKNGSYTQTANGTMIGQVIASGGVSKGGNADVFLYEQIIPFAPGTIPGETTQTNIPVLSAWQR